MSEAKGQIVVATRSEQSERAFQMMSRFDICTGELMGDSLDPMRYPGLARIGRRLDVAEENCRVRSHRRQLASHVGMFGISLQQDVAADPVEEGVGPTLTRPPRQRHRFINMRQGCFSPLPFGFELRKAAQKMREKAPELSWTPDLGPLAKV
jgi:hypothetical protein